MRDGQVITATATAHYGPAQSCGLYGIDAVEEAVALAPETAARWTAPKLFELARSLEERLGEKKWKVTLEFDQELGFPRALFSDNEEMYDDDWGISVSRLERLGP